MADYMSWQETTIRQVFSLRVPASAAELSKMMTAACQKFHDAHGREPSDDAITVTVTDEEIHVSFPVLAQQHHRDDGKAGSSE